MALSRNLTDLPYEQRRLVAVTSSSPMPSNINKIKKFTSEHRGATVAGGAAAVVGAALFSPVLLPVAGVAGVAGVVMGRRSLQDTAGMLNSKGINLLLISDDEAKQLIFPIGHWRPKVIYVGHPVNPSEYFPFSDFHRALFEHKVAEALRLVTGLGAKSVVVEHVQGWGRELGVNIGVGAPNTLGAEVSASAGLQRSQGTYIMSRMTLHPSGPAKVPPGLVWLPQEPLWREVVRARLE